MNLLHTKKDAISEWKRKKTETSVWVWVLERICDEGRNQKKEKCIYWKMLKKCSSDWGEIAFALNKNRPFQMEKKLLRVVSKYLQDILVIKRSKGKSMKLLSKQLGHTKEVSYCVSMQLKSLVNTCTFFLGFGWINWCMW